MSQKVIQEITDHLKASSPAVNELSSDEMLFESGIIDSFAMVELIVFLESRYSVKFTSDDLVKENLETVKKIADLVAKKKQP